MNTTMNATLSTILNATITAKKKGEDGKYTSYTTTMLEDSFKHVPKAKELSDEQAKSALSALDKVFDYMETASTATTDNQRDKAVNKAYEYARSFLKSVGMNTGTGNVAMLTSVFAPKKQTTKGTVKGGYTTKSTFIKYALYLSYNFAQTGQWCAPKSASKSTPKATTFEELEQVYITTFGFSPEVARELVAKAKAAKAQVA